jgi:hypothetical protein
MGPKDHLVYKQKRAAEYSAALAQQPQRFYELLPASHQDDGLSSFSGV